MANAKAIALGIFTQNADYLSLFVDSELTDFQGICDYFSYIWSEGFFPDALD